MYFPYGETELAYLRRRDRRLGAVIDRVGYVDRAVDADLFSSVVHHIIGQQISTKAQATVWRRMQEALETVDAGSVLAAGPEGLQALGISGRKAAYITDFALRVQSGAFDPETVRESSDAEAIRQLYAEHEAEVHFWKFCQYEFSLQWTALKAYAGENGIEIMGDIPIYVAADSADVWAQPAQFRLDPDGQPSAVAGVPPDYFSADGQLWGNPLYDWDAMRADGFRWWKDRIRGAAKRYDVVRLDHFRAISSYWVVPRGELTARGGHWAPGPGPALLQALHTAAPELELIAEDLGTIDDDVRRLVARSGCPGMRVLLFGFDPSGTSEHRPDRVRAHSVCYVGTHDNAPAAAWAALGGADADYAMRCLGVYDVARLPEALLRAGMGSRAELFIAQMQDVLGLGAESRMNTPGTAAGNWVWRLLPGQADARTAARLLARTQAACRA